MDYSIQVSRIFWYRAVMDMDIALFSTSDVPGLYDAFGLPEFDALYEV